MPDPILQGVNKHARRVRTNQKYGERTFRIGVIVTARWGRKGPSASGEVLDRAIRLAHEAGRLEGFKCGDFLQE